MVTILLYYSISIILIYYLYKKFFISPELLFVLMQFVMFTGILSYIDFSLESDRLLIVLYLIALISFVLGCKVSDIFFKTNKKIIIVDKSRNHLGNNQKALIVIIILFSIAFCSLFFIKAGGNVLLMILNSLGSGANYTEVRLSFNKMSGIGYLYQFRVVLLPLLCAFLVSSYESNNIKIFGACCFPFMMLFLLGTGQRGGFAIFVLTWVVALVYIYKLYKNERIKIFLILLISSSIAIFAVLTIFNGRVISGGNVIQAILRRIFNDNQLSAVIGFRYIYTQPVQWGRDWFYSFMDLLPGKNNYQQISYTIFSIMYGSTRGTAPPCIWGSVYYNWGILGIFVFPFMMGIFYHMIFCVFTKGEMSMLKIFIFSAMFVILGNWVADSPLFLFNQGFITLCILKAMLLPRKNIKFNNVVIFGNKNKSL